MTRLRVDDAVEVTVDSDRLVIAVRGEVDAQSAPVLRMVMSGVGDARHTDVVLDLAKVTFLGAAGLNVLAEAALSLSTAGRTLHVRSASPFAVRLLRITRLAELVHLEHPAGEASNPSDGEQSAFAANVVQVGSMITATATLDKALQVVTTLARSAVDGADGVSVSLERGALLSTVAWTNQTVLKMDLHQYETGEGPCIDAAATGRWFHIEALSDEARWPAFVPRAVEEGIASILSTPLRTPNRSVGALNLYSSVEGAFGERQLELAGLFAEQASGIVAAGLGDGEAGARLAQALVEREVIAQAQGVLMANHRVTAIDAASRLFSAARAAGIKVSDQAAIEVDAVSPDSDGGGRP